MLRMVLVASLSEANSGHTVTAGKSSSLSLTLSMVLVPGSSSQELKMMDKSRIWREGTNLHVGILDEKSQKTHRAPHQEHPDHAVQPVLSIDPVSDPMDSGFLKNISLKS